MRLLLDTCTFLWCLEGGAQLSPVARGALEEGENEVYLSSVSTWEIAVKHGLGRLPLPEPPERYLPRQRQARGIAALALTEAATLFLHRLPALHRDPFDRMLVCQAMAEGLTLVTPDDDVRQYPVPHLW